jgi:hypothetical protein
VRAGDPNPPNPDAIGDALICQIEDCKTLADLQNNAAQLMKAKNQLSSDGAKKVEASFTARLAALDGASRLLTAELTKGEGGRSDRRHHDHPAAFATAQMSALRWLDSGVTKSYGTVSEPCALTEKFPAASVLVKNYFLGNTAL